MTATELLAAYAARERSPVEVVADLAAKIEADEHGAFWALCLDRAAEEARNAEARWADGTARPLEGVPLAVKDIFDTAGVETTYGSAMFRGHVPERDAAAVRIAREAGAIVVGKTATHEFAWGFSSINDAMGTVRNPRDPERVAGGSSGGSGAALAAGLVPLALGSDTGGSIRVPSAFCGVHGLKPTFGRISLDGVWPLARTLDHAGPMARSIPDLRLLYEILARPLEIVAVLKVGICPDLHLVALEPHIEAALQDAAEGAVEVAFPEAPLILDAFRVVQLAEGHDTHRRAGLFPERADEYGADVRGRIELGGEVTLPELLDAVARREAVRAAFTRVFDEVDVLITPAVPCAPPLIEEERATEGLRAKVAPCTTPQDFAGLPACVLPNGLQVTGPPGGEAKVLSAAAALERRS
jgi:aspartyl-tRNA(Asn)/glutamyl-tRNA(Gln) amidotransferase subunit A